MPTMIDTINKKLSKILLIMFVDTFTVGVPAEALDDEEEGPEETEPLGVGKR